MTFCFNPAAQTGRISSPAPTPLAKLRWVYAGLGLMKCKPRLMLIAATYISLYWAFQLSLESRALAVNQTVLELALSGCVINRMFCKLHPVFSAIALICFGVFFTDSFHFETTPE